MKQVNKEPKKTRVVRIFISSTFRDLLKERRHLVDVIFPQLRHYFKKRQIDIAEIDLSWGIKEQDSKNGKTISLCLQEIDKSRPFFIGIIGSRYGWIPQEADIANAEALYAKYEWLKDSIKVGHSVTEMEMTLGAFSQEDSISAVFFVQDPIITLSDEDEFSQTKLKNLREKILEQKKYPVYTFCDEKTLGSQVFDVLRDLIESEYPDSEKDVSSNDLIKEQDYILKKRSEHYIRREELESDIWDFIDDKISPMQISQVYGPPGCGKSMLVSNIARTIQEKRTEMGVIYCAIGDSYLSNKHNIATYIIAKMSELNGNNDTGMYLSEYDKRDIYIKNKLTECFNKTDAQQKYLIILDGLDELDMADDSYNLEWLPKMPQNIKLILVSRTLDNYGAFYYQVRETGHLFSIGDKIEVGEFNSLEIELFCQKYLEAYGKCLDEKQLEIVKKNNTSAPPLLIKLILDNLRYYGDFESLTKRFENLIFIKDISDFIGILITETCKQQDTLTLYEINSILSVLFISRYGYNEKELASIVNLSDLQCSLFLELFDAFISKRSGLITLQVWVYDVLKEYLRENIDLAEIGTVVEKYLEHRISNEIDERVLNEYPFILRGFNKLDKLVKFSDSYHVLSYWYNKDPKSNTEWYSYITYMVRNEIDLDKIVSYEITKENAEILYHFAVFLSELRQYKYASNLLKKLYEFYCNENNEYDRLQKAKVLTEISRYKYNKFIDNKEGAYLQEAMALLDLGNYIEKFEYAKLLNNLGWDMYEMGEFNLSYKLYCGSLEIYNELSCSSKEYIKEETLLEEVAIGYSRMAILLASKKDISVKDVEYYAKNADYLAQRLLDISAIRYNECVLNIETNIINSYIVIREFNIVETLMKCMIHTFRDYSKRFPHRIAYKFGMLLTNYASILTESAKESNIGQIKDLYVEAINLYQSYIYSIGGTFDKDSAFGVLAYYYLGRIYESENIEEAIECYQIGAYSAIRTCTENHQTEIFIEKSIKAGLNICMESNNPKASISKFVGCCMALIEFLSDNIDRNQSPSDKYMSFADILNTASYYCANPQIKLYEQAECLLINAITIASIKECDSDTLTTYVNFGINLAVLYKTLKRMPDLWYTIEQLITMLSDFVEEEKNCITYRYLLLEVYEFALYCAEEDNCLEKITEIQECAYPLLETILEEGTEIDNKCHYRVLAWSCLSENRSVDIGKALEKLNELYESMSSEEQRQFMGLRKLLIQKYE